MVAALLGLRFVLELALVASMGLVAARLSGNAVMAWVLAVGAVGLTVVVWGAFLAPRRRVDLPLPARVALEWALFAVAAAGLALTGDPVWGVALLGADVIVVVLLWSRGLPPGSDAGARERPPNP